MNTAHLTHPYLHARIGKRLAPSHHSAANEAVQGVWCAGAATSLLPIPECKAPCQHITGHAFGSDHDDAIRAQHGPTCWLSPTPKIRPNGASSGAIAYARVDFRGASAATRRIANPPRLTEPRLDHRTSANFGALSSDPRALCEAGGATAPSQRAIAGEPIRRGLRVVAHAVLSAEVYRRNEAGHDGGERPAPEVTRLAPGHALRMSHRSTLPAFGSLRCTAERQGAGEQHRPNASEQRVSGGIEPAQPPSQGGHGQHCHVGHGHPPDPLGRDASITASPHYPSLHQPGGQKGAC